MSDTPENRYGLIVRLAKGMPAGTKMGRTALMKFVYILQTVKDVPLDYKFTLYTYGPFDSSVLGDLAYVQDHKGVKSTIVYYPGGYGYEIEPNVEADAIEEKASGFLTQYAEAIGTVLKDFGSLSPAELELASTIIYADREAEGKLSLGDLTKRVSEIKPRFTQSQIELSAKELQAKNYIPIRE